MPSPTSEPTQAAATAASTGTPFDATAASHPESCAKEKHQTAVVGGAIGGVFGAIIVGLLGALLWMYKQEKHHRRMKEHYEEQFLQTTAYRRTIASSAASLMGGDIVEVNSKAGRS
jgi:predicted histidine transporter YuiF (NhaC family)